MKVSGYYGSKSEVLTAMAAEHKQARADMLNRKLAARLHKDLLDQQDEPRVHFCAGKQGKHIWGC
jgi:hypothetical protein